ncbi:MAG: peptidoglycan DL-endopeptidase CwlO [Actinomycetota bacterium]|nr:peptidoglycan DL-endopeptidase CwlO [Actinomycetota bacterium]
MGSHRGAGIVRARHVALSLALGLAFGATTIAVPAGATPQNDLSSKTAQARQLESQIAANSQRADMLDEQYLQAQSAVADANRKILIAEKGIADARAQEAQLRARLGGRAALLYMGAGSGDPLGINASSVQELGSRAKYGEAAAETDNRMIDQLKVLDEQLQRQTADLEKQRAEAQDRQKVAEAAHRDVAQINAKMQRLLSSTKSDIVALANKIEQQRLAAEAAAERARIQAEAARQAAQLAAQQAAQQAAARAPAGNGLGVSPGAGNTGADLGPIPAPSGGAAAAVAYARAQLGKPYQYAGVGPDSFDCSGLTMMAWRQGGVSMAHGSQAQYMAFPHVPISELQPGDLVFFGSSGPTNHHVGIVVGPGVMIDAPHTGSFVQQVSYYRSDLVPLGSRP